MLILQGRTHNQKDLLAIIKKLVRGSNMRLFSLNKIVFAVALISFSISVTAKDLATSSKSVDENSEIRQLGF